MLVKKPKVPPILVIIFGILAVSTSSILIRYAQMEAGSLVIAAYRLTIASFILIPFTIAKKRAELRILGRNDYILAIISGFFLSIHFAAWISSLEYTSIASSVVLVSTTPLWVAIFSPITIKEKVSKQVVIGLIVSLAGTVIISVSDICQINGNIICPSLSELTSGRAFLGDFLALIGSWMGAGYILIGRKLREKTSTLSYITLVYSIAAVFLLILMFISGEKYSGFSNQTYLYLALLAIIPQLLGHTSFNWALGYLSAAFISITLLGEPVGSTILGYIIFSETPSPINIFGAILILIGILIAFITKNKS